jgi:hypothetical protein
MSKKIGTHPTLFLVPTRFARHPVLTEAMNLSGSIKSGRGLNPLGRLHFFKRLSGWLFNVPEIVTSSKFFRGQQII